MEVKKLEETALGWPEQAKDIHIFNQASYDEAAVLITRIVSLRKQVVEHHAPVKDAANKAHKEACAAERRLLAPLSEAETTIKNALMHWDRQQQALHAAEQKRLQEQARKEEEDVRLELAGQAFAEGASDEVIDEILDTPTIVPTSIVAAPTYAKASGISTRTLYSAEVTNIRVLCAAVAAGTASDNLVLANGPAINGLARSMKDSFRVPGCQLVKRDTMAVR